MNIRKAKHEDKKQLIKLMDEFNDYYYENNIFSPEFKPFWEYKDKIAIFTETVEEWLTDKKHYMFVSEERKHLLGYICGHVQNRAPRVLDKEGYIDDWFVRKNWRSKGLGRALFDALVKEFKKEHCNRLGLLTKVGNKHAIDFYHKLGFIDESLTMVRKLE